MAEAQARPPGFKQALLGGALAGTAVDAALFPLDTIKTRLQSRAGFLASGGFKGVYSGLLSAVVGSAPNAALFFVTYEFTKRVLKGFTTQDHLQPFIHMAAASVGEVSACTVRVPTEVIKQRMQTGQYPTTSQAVRSVLRSEGLLGFYRGYLTTVAREIPFTCIQFPIYEYCKKLYTQIYNEPIHPMQAALCGSLAGGLAAAATTPLDVVKTRIMLSSKIANGTLVGKHLDGFNQDIFIGIPYAQPPTGELRFAPPQPLNSAWGSRKAVKYGNSCYAFGPYTDNDGFVQSEDCLTLNIVRPSGYENQALPVGVWIYGGGFQQGVSARDLYNLSYPVQQSVMGNTPVIGVSINYRLGAFGFLASSEVLHAGDMNNGLKDQILALRWIQENIGAFGGDPTKVTIWGESAGGESVAMLLTAYGGKLNGLFRGAIMESGSSTTQQYLPVGAWQGQYRNLTKFAGCDKAADSLQCLRTAPIEKLVTFFNVTNGLGHTLIKYNPTVDGDVIPQWPKDLLAQGKFVNVPMISGANLDEGTAFGAGKVDTTKELSAWLTQSYPTLHKSTVSEILRLYPNDPSIGCPYGTGNLYSNKTFGLQYKRGSSIGGDIVMVAPRRLTCETWTKAGAAVYSYNWNQSDYTTPPQAGSTHFQEVVYVFDNPAKSFPQSKAAPIGPDPTGEKKKLADQISRYFMSFIATGDPNKAEQEANYPAWPKRNSNSGRPMYNNHEQVDTMAQLRYKMKGPIFTQFCWAAPLKSGVIVLAFINLVLGIAFLSVYAEYLTVYNYAGEQGMAVSGSTAILALDVIVHVFILISSLAALVLGFTGKGKLIWFWFGISYYVATVVAFIFNVVAAALSAGLIPAFIAALILDAIFFLYFALTAHSYYHVLLNPELETQLESMPAGQQGGYDPNQPYDPAYPQQQPPYGEDKQAYPQQSLQNHVQQPQPYQDQPQQPYPQSPQPQQQPGSYGAPAAYPQPQPQTPDLAQSPMPVPQQYPPVSPPHQYDAPTEQQPVQTAPYPPPQ
ncbi:hypothetical protein BZG36_02513 [Bifiguratus adelaidae]|uniref:Carboxylesterase type B domain-containing protein n=1 Tax=Bifiguratus adelaidae TaxID=1938954 RepID=A0A261Y2R3_9FUNG|nr:hypothetical protein BZG36_02513 [Bifiguratus adelaidae]